MRAFKKLKRGFIKRCAIQCQMRIKDFSKRFFFLLIGAGGVVLFLFITGRIEPGPMRFIEIALEKAGEAAADAFVEGGRAA